MTHITTNQTKIGVILDVQVFKNWKIALYLVK